MPAAPAPEGGIRGTGNPHGVWAPETRAVWAGRPEIQGPAQPL